MIEEGQRLCDGLAPVGLALQVLLEDCEGHDLGGLDANAECFAWLRAFAFFRIQVNADIGTLNL